MFRRRTSSPGKIHYRININKNMCPNPIYILMEIHINMVLTDLILIYIIRR